MLSNSLSYKALEHGGFRTSEFNFLKKMLYPLLIYDLWLKVIRMKYTTLKKKGHVFFQKVAVFDFCL
ncbi:MAG: hypothetical protein CMM15_04510 [Rhodospirillaceae bacterium]|nr:hypothetical protein [Rhodospirillaceae bacterium]